MHMYKLFSNLLLFVGYLISRFVPIKWIMSSHHLSFVYIRSHTEGEGVVHSVLLMHRSYISFALSHRCMRMVYVTDKTQNKNCCRTTTILLWTEKIMENLARWFYTTLGFTRKNSQAGKCSKNTYQVIVNTYLNKMELLCQMTSYNISNGVMIWSMFPTLLMGSKDTSMDFLFKKHTPCKWNQTQYHGLRHGWSIYRIS